MLSLPRVGDYEWIRGRSNRIPEARACHYFRAARTKWPTFSIHFQRHFRDKNIVLVHCREKQSHIHNGVTLNSSNQIGSDSPENIFLLNLITLKRCCTKRKCRHALHFAVQESVSVERSYPGYQCTPKELPLNIDHSECHGSLVRYVKLHVICSYINDVIYWTRNKQKPPNKYWQHI